MQTHLSQTIDITTSEDNYSAKYDASIKEMLADKQVLARILKYTLDEFKDLSLEAIIQSIDEPVISAMRIEPGHTNTDKIKKTAEEDNVLGEGKIYYDIRFNAYSGDEQIKILINVEAQKSTRASKLGYHLDNRIIYYLARMISAQKEVEFEHSNYDDLKPVKSIWICMDTANDEDSINRINLTQETLFGKDMHLPNINKVQGVVIRLRKNKDVEISKNLLIAMLEELLRKDKADSKKRKLSEQYGMIMDIDTERRVNTMCNLSEALIEETREETRKETIVEAREQGIKFVVTDNILEGKSREQIVQKLMRGFDIDKETSEMYYDKFKG